MNKFFTLAALGLLSVAAQPALAQISVDGKVSAAEIGTGVGKYQLVGAYTGTHSAVTRGIQALYVGSSASKLYLGVVGSSESATNYPSIVVYLNVPGKTGIASGTQLLGGSAGDSPLKHTPTMDMETDYAFRATTAPVGDDNVYYSFADYTVSSTAKANDSYQGNSKKDGVAITGSAADGPFKGAKYSYLKATDIAAATTAGSGLEVELDLAAMGLKTGDRVDVFVGYTQDGGDFTSDVIPAVVGQTTDLGSSPDFTKLAGKQTAAYAIGTGVLASREAVARQLGFEVYPNPGRNASIIYKVDGQQDVTLQIVNVLGQEISRVSGRQNGVQSYSLPEVAAGTYVVKLQVGDNLTTRKVVVK